MLIVVELPEVEETFQFDLEDSATIAQLKSELEDETSFSPERQNLYFSVVFWKINDFINTFSLSSLILTLSDL